MSALALFMLAAGLNSAVVTHTPSPAAASRIRQAEMSLNRSVAAAEPHLRRRVVDRALSDGRRAFGQALAREIATTRVITRTSGSGIRHQAESALDRRVEVAVKESNARAVEQLLRECRRDFSRMLAEEIAALRPALQLTLESVSRKSEDVPNWLR